MKKLASGLCLIIAIVVALLSNVFPIIGSAWAVESNWSSVWSHTAVRIVFLLIAFITAYWLFKHKFYLLIVSTLPLAYLSIIPVDRLSVDSQLLTNPVAFERLVRSHEFQPLEKNKIDPIITSPDTINAFLNTPNDALMSSKIINMIFNKSAPTRFVDDWENPSNPDSPSKKSLAYEILSSKAPLSIDISKIKSEITALRSSTM